MLTIEYHKNGIYLPDYDIEQSVLDIIKQYLDAGGENIKVATANELVIETFRALVVEKKINHQEIQFLFKGKPIVVDEHGNLSNWPIGFCDYTDKVLTRILKWNKT